MIKLILVLILLCTPFSASAGDLQILSASRSGGSLSVVVAVRNDSSSQVVGDFAYSDFFGSGYSWGDSHDSSVPLPSTLAAGATFSYTVVMSGIPDSAFSNSGSQVDIYVGFYNPDSGEGQGGEYFDTFANLMAQYGSSSSAASGSGSAPPVALFGSVVPSTGGYLHELISRYGVVAILVALTISGLLFVWVRTKKAFH